MSASVVARGEVRPQHWWSSVRAKTVLIALVIVSIALGVSSVVLVTQLRSSHSRTVDGALRIELTSLMAINRGGVFPNPLRVTSQDTPFLQVVTAKGHVVASSSSLEGENPIVHWTGTQPIVFRTFDHLPLGSGGRLRVAATNVYATSGQLTLHAGESLEALDQSLHTIVVGLLIADPLLVVIVGGTV